MINTFFWALSSAFVVSLVSLVGLATLPLRAEKLNAVILWLISLATGALFGDAVFHLLPDIFGGNERPLVSSCWLLGGILSSFVFEKFLRWKYEHGLHDNHTIKPVGRIILLSDSLHNFVDGLLIGASYLTSHEVGLATTLAVVLHEIPHEMGDFGVLLDAGWTRSKALFFNFLSAGVAILGVVAAFVFQGAHHTFSEAVLAVTAGSFLYIAGSNLTPELHKEQRPLKSLYQFIGILAGVGLMALLLLLEK